LSPEEASIGAVPFQEAKWPLVDVMGEFSRPGPGC
jgi:hypothetical protein